MPDQLPQLELTHSRHCSQASVLWEWGGRTVDLAFCDACDQGAVGFLSHREGSPSSARVSVCGRGQAASVILCSEQETCAAVGRHGWWGSGWQQRGKGRKETFHSLLCAVALNSRARLPSLSCVPTQLPCASIQHPVHHS